MAPDAARFRCLRPAPRGAGSGGPGPLRRSARGDSIGTRAMRPGRGEKRGRRSTRAQVPERWMGEQGRGPRDVAASSDISLFVRGARRSMTPGRYPTGFSFRMEICTPTRISTKRAFAAGSRGFCAVERSPGALHGVLGLPGSDRAAEDGRYPLRSGRPEGADPSSRRASPPLLAVPVQADAPVTTWDRDSEGPGEGWAAHRDEHPPGYDAAANSDSFFVLSRILHSLRSGRGRGHVSALPGSSAPRRRIEAPPARTTAPASRHVGRQRGASPLSHASDGRAGSDSHNGSRTTRFKRHIPSERIGRPVGFGGQCESTSTLVPRTP